MNKPASQASTSTPPPSERARIRRAAERGHYDSTTLEAIIDEAWLCHVAFACPDVMCIPTACWRVEDKLYIHGSNGSRMMKHLASGAPACVSITHLDGLVMARSAFSHSMNYRSVVIHGRFEPMADADKPDVLHAFLARVVPGRENDCRTADANELAATTVLGMRLSEAAAKVRNWGPRDSDDDLALPHWAGVLPLRMERLPAITHEASLAPVPDYVHQWLARSPVPGMK
jgi:uncharacterized protein